MGKVFASCGHELTEAEGFGKDIHTRAWSRESTHAVDYQCVCDKCFDFYEKEGAILTPQQANEWLNFQHYELDAW